ncbi:MAG: SDR family NAD(P)-dependent oxidoreductase [Flavobacteriales bacterium]
MKTYLIVGGTSGIGLAISKLLLSHGNRTIIMSRNEPLEIPDNSEFHSWDAMKDPFPVLEYESLDGMVYCPGSILLKPFHRISDLEFQEAFQLNALGAAKALQAVFPLLRKSENGSVVLFSTVAVQTGMPFHSSVAMAKGAVEGLTKSLAAEWAPVIRVNCIAPSLTQTPLAEKLLSSPEKIEAGGKRHPMGRIGQPEDIAHMAAFLLEENSSWITGQIFAVDGGMGNLRT